MGVDNRQIQTAVLADPESDDPVVCPTDANELDDFREEFAGTTFWCGILLGGCGGELTTRRGNVRVSHFAHFPDPDGLRSECGRRSRGTTSADHLYVRTATQTWLRRQGHQPRYRYVDRDDAPVGSVVEIELDGRTLLVHMDPTAPPDWDTAQAGDIILGPGVSIDHRTLVRRGYVHRVRFVSEGNERVMMLGTELPWLGTDWDFELADCTVGEDGRLITPVITRVAAARAAQERAPVPQPRQEKAEGPVQIGALTRQIGSAVQKKEIIAVRELLDTARLQVPRCEGQALEHLRRAIGWAEDLLNEQDRIRRGLFTGIDEALRHSHVVTVTKLASQVRKLLDHDVEATAQEAGILQAADAFLEQARLDRAQKRREEDVRRAAEAEEWRRRRNAAATRDQQALLVAQALERKARNRARGLVQSITGRLRREALSAQQQRELVQELTVAAEEAGGLLPEAEQDKVRKWTTKIATPAKEPVTAETPSPVVQPQPDAEPTKLPDRLVPIVAAVRGALKKAARERTPTSWSRLEQQLGSALPSLTGNERVQVLVQIDKSTDADAPLLSSLLAAGDPHFAYQYYRCVLTALGLDAPTDDDLQDVVEADAEQVFTDWRLH
ncbi:hypothetical protein [Streptomyces sp. NBC_00525]|uniref:hypothetical protein n=1 Tax=Streptomyces sp. NBC_00525 TaxID=2903660 RepID=UPI002E811F30|nr:hypothetical protein [Streptomyces sp. NBC_00525]WUC98118.1 hypothetical protein OG710_31115 [Streptomyces sp. NBC_00525]